MKKITPDPPETSSVPPVDSKKLHEAAERALDHHLKPSLDNLRSSNSPTTNLFTVSTHIDTESLLANASETLASANAIACDLAFDLEGAHRSVALGIYQMIELGKLLVDQALEQVDQRVCRGNGYRAYNPTLMRFHSPDSWSPFGRGGLNAYMYCVGDPVNFSDPTGHAPWFTWKGFKSLFRSKASTYRPLTNSPSSNAVAGTSNIQNHPLPPAPPLERTPTHTTVPLPRSETAPPPLPPREGYVNWALPEPPPRRPTLAFGAAVDQQISNIPPLNQSSTPAPQFSVSGPGSSGSMFDQMGTPATTSTYQVAPDHRGQSRVVLPQSTLPPRNANQVVRDTRPRGRHGDPFLPGSKPFPRVDRNRK